jgi:hypothetical protein
MLNGKKTYIFGALAICSVFLRVFDLIDHETMIALLGIFLASGEISLRHAIARG